jgi:hypothetical protein
VGVDSFGQDCIRVLRTLGKVLGCRNHATLLTRRDHRVLLVPEQDAIFNFARGDILSFGVGFDNLGIQNGFIGFASPASRSWPILLLELHRAGSCLNLSGIGRVITCKLARGQRHGIEDRGLTVKVV